MTSNRLTRSQSIKRYCKESCCAGDLTSWKECAVSSCMLWNFRLGRETLAKPNSFKKQRKTRVFLAKNEVQEELSDGRENEN